MQVLDEGRCEQHHDQSLTLYCCQCNKLLCTVCVLGKHKDHILMDIIDVKELIDTILKVLLRIIRKHTINIEKNLKELVGQRQNIAEELNTVTLQIKKCADAAHGSYTDQNVRVRKREQDMLQEIMKVKDDAITKVTEIHEMLTQYAETGQKIISEIDTMLSTAALQEKLTAVFELDEKLHRHEILPVPCITWQCNIQYVDEPVNDSLGHISVTQSEMADNGFYERLLLPPLQNIKLKYTGKDPTTGLIIVHPYMYTTHFDDSSIWIYSLETGDLITKCGEAQLYFPYGMICVGRDPTKLAITGREQIYLITLTSKHRVSSREVCPLDYVPDKVSLDTAERIAVPDTENNMIRILSSNDGQLLHTIPAKQHGISHLQQALPTKSGYVVLDSSSEPEHTFKKSRLLWLNSDGSLAHIYGLRQHEQLIVPYYMIMDGAGRLIVADTRANRVQLVSGDGDFLQYLIVGSEEDSFATPECLYLDEDTGLLYMAHDSSDNHDVRVYKYPSTELPLTPFPQKVTHLEIDVSLQKF